MASGGRSNPSWVRAQQRDVYRIIDEAEFVEAAAYREHYETTASRIAARLIAAREKARSQRTIRTRSWKSGLGSHGRQRISRAALCRLVERRSQAGRRCHEQAAPFGAPALTERCTALDTVTATSRSATVFAFTIAIMRAGGQAAASLPAGPDPERARFRSFCGATFAELPRPRA